MPRGTKAKPQPESGPAVRVRPLRRDDWNTIESLFGPKGACGGCWCMLWRAEFGGKRWRGSLGEPNRRAFEELVTAGEVHGIVAFAGSEPVGWCSIGPRGDFPGLERSRVLRTDWTPTSWSVTCFFIPTKYRGRGVATVMLEAAVELARKRGATEIEGYPQKAARDGTPMPGPFVWTGVPALFEKCGFKRINPGEGRPIYVRKLVSRSRATTTRNAKEKQA